MKSNKSLTDVEILDPSEKPDYIKIDQELIEKEYPGVIAMWGEMLSKKIFRVESKEKGRTKLYLVRWAYERYGKRDVPSDAVLKKLQRAAERNESGKSGVPIIKRGIRK